MVLQFSNDREACLRLLGAAQMASAGDVTPPVTAKTSPANIFVKNSAGVDVMQVNVTFRKRVVLDKAVYHACLKQATKHLPATATTEERKAAATTEQLAALLVVSRVGSYMCNETDREASYSGLTCVFAIGAAKRTSTTPDGVQSRFAYACSVLKLPTSELQVATIESVDPQKLTTTLRWEVGGGSDQFAGWDEDDANDTDQKDNNAGNKTSTISLTQEQWDDMSAADIKAKLTAAGITTFTAGATKSALKNLVVIA